MSDWTHIALDRRSPAYRRLPQRYTSAADLLRVADALGTGERGRYLMAATFGKSMARTRDALPDCVPGSCATARPRWRPAIHEACELTGSAGRALAARRGRRLTTSG